MKAGPSSFLSPGHYSQHGRLIILFSFLFIHHIAFNYVHILCFPFPMVGVYLSLDLLFSLLPILPEGCFEHHGSLSFSQAFPFSHPWTPQCVPPGRYQSLKPFFCILRNTWWMYTQGLCLHVTKECRGSPILFLQTDGFNLLSTSLIPHWKEMSSLFYIIFKYFHTMEPLFL